MQSEGNQRRWLLWIVLLATAAASAEASAQQDQAQQQIQQQLQQQLQLQLQHLLLGSRGERPSHHDHKPKNNFNGLFLGSRKTDFCARQPTQSSCSIRGIRVIRVIREVAQPAKPGAPPELLTFPADSAHRPNGNF
jgi:hypothetical protein